MARRLFCKKSGLQCVMTCPRACRDFGPRGDRQKTRLMWLVEAMGVGAFREKVGEYMGGVKLRTAVEEKVSSSHASCPVGTRKLPSITFPK